MDGNWRSTIDENKYGNWCRTTYGENKCTFKHKQGVGTEVVVEGI
jgi:hypothetical protein